MADVFISYARADRVEVERLVEEIRAVGLTVWWDGDLAPTEEWDDAIERELIAAKSVVVVWTPNSVTNDNVREEAHEARNLQKIAAVKLGDCRPPMFFRRHQFEDLTDWRGNGATREFQKLAIQLVAMARGQEAAEAMPLDGETPPRIAAETRLPEAETNWFERVFAIGGIGAVVVGFVLNYRDVQLADFVGVYWAWVVVLALSAIALFRAAEYALPEGRKALVARWLRGEKSYTSTQAFLTMFEAVFGPRHATWRCLGASVAATLSVYLLLLALFIDVDRLFAQATSEGAFRPDIAGEDWQLKEKLERSALLLLVIVPLTNIVADYVSLWQTRKVLQWSAGWLPLWIGVAVDAVLTLAVFVLLLPIGPMISIFVSGGEIWTGSDSTSFAAFSGVAFEQAIAFAPEVWRGFWAIFEGHPTAEIDAVIAAEASLSTTTLLIAFVTTFITSVWLWFALLAAPLFWLMAAGRRKGAGLLGRIAGFAGKPILSLGYGAAAVVLVLGYGGQAIAGLLREAREPTPFRDCAVCPWMVEIPAGDFPPGTQFAEAGVRIERRFAMGVYEVTFREWEACVADGFCRSQPAPPDFGWGRGLRPVVDVSWDDVTGEDGFLAWLNERHAPEDLVYRLPSEAEWEYATRARTDTAYWMGDTITHKNASFDDQSLGATGTWGKTSFSGHVRGQTLPVGAFEANASGLYDVHGNVWEWAQDCWHGDLTGAPKDGSAWMEDGEGDCSQAVLRGGSWSDGSVGLLSTVRFIRYLRSNRDRDIGFRVSRTLDP